MTADLNNWGGRPAPHMDSVEGRFCRIDAARFADDGAGLFSVLGGAENDDLWRHIPFGPFETAEALGAGMGFVAETHNWRSYVIRDIATTAPLGMASYMRIRPEAGSAEIGCIVLSKKLQRTPAATEAMYLFAKHIFDDLGYRRYEWKCNNKNEASKRAALRLGFAFEGVFRQDMVVKGENRDTAWFSIIDTEWPRAKSAFENWLAPDNFDADGRQRRSLADFRA